MHLDISVAKVPNRSLDAAKMTNRSLDAAKVPNPSPELKSAPFFVSTAAVHAMEMSDSTLMRVSLTRAQAALDELRAKKLLPPPAGVGRGPTEG